MPQPDTYELIDPEGHPLQQAVTADAFHHAKAVVLPDKSTTTYAAAGYGLGANERTREPYAPPSDRTAKKAAEKKED